MRLRASRRTALTTEFAKHSVAGWTTTERMAESCLLRGRYLLASTRALGTKS